MTARKAASALGVVAAAAEKLRVKHGQGYYDPTSRAHDLLFAVVNAAEAVCEAKGYYYEQACDNENALDMALMLWADRVDALDRALSAARSMP